MFLAWLFHTVGDIHQPLHSTALFSTRLFPAGDRGGNSVKTQQAGNLHALWDQFPGQSDAFGEARSKAIGDPAKPEIAALGVGAVMNLDEKAWLDESHDLAKSQVYTAEVLAALRRMEAVGDAVEPLGLSEDYLKSGGRVAERRGGGWLSARCGAEDAGAGIGIFQLSSEVAYRAEVPPLREPSRCASRACGPLPRDIREGSSIPPSARELERAQVGVCSAGEDEAFVRSECTTMGSQQIGDAVFLKIFLSAKKSAMFHICRAAPSSSEHPRRPLGQTYWGDAGANSTCPSRIC